MCGNTFSGSSALKTHMLTHSKSKSHQCNRCEKKFVDHRTLERHQRTHSDDIAYECTLCPAKSTRKDNIRRHVRNLHSNSDDELQTILEKIIQNFSGKHKKKKSKKTEKTISSGSGMEVAKTSECEPNKLIDNTTSVIKFAGRTNQPDENSLIDLGGSTECGNDLNLPVSTSQEEKQTEDEGINSSADIATELPSLSYEPLNLDPFPEIISLPMINTNTNLNVYRQLLSPYLKKATNSNEECSSKSMEEPAKESTKPSSKPIIVIDRPPKKMIEKYEFYQK